MRDVNAANSSNESAFATLWRRAPLWRATFVGASIVTLAAAVFWSESLETLPPAAASAHSGIAPAPTMSAPQASQRRTAAPDPSATTASRLTDGGPSVAQSSAAAPVSDEEEQLLATCHPHLVRTPSSMPQIDVATLSEPNLGHIKMHFWVNGAGVVTREVLTAATFGTPAEQQAEAAYARGLTFSLPNTKECRSREVEVIGDFFEQRDPRGQWATYVRLYPRLSFSNTGMLERRD